MDIDKIIKERHSVRAYTEKDIEQNIIDEINKDIEEYNNIIILQICISNLLQMNQMLLVRVF